jgi:hypothetical protein
MASRLKGMAFAALILAFGWPAAATPPPPAVVDGMRITACGAGPEPLRPIDLGIRTTAVPEAAVGGRGGRLGAFRYRWGLQLNSQDARFGHVVGLAYSRGLGVIAATDTGFWLRIPLNEETYEPVNTVDAYAIRGPDEPISALSASIDGYSSVLAVYPKSARVLRYEFAHCGLRALGQPAFTIGAETRVNDVGVLKDALMTSDYTQLDYILALGSIAGRPAGGGAKLVSGGMPLQLGASFTPMLAGYRTVGIVGYETAAGCDALALQQATGRKPGTVVQAFCSPHYREAAQIQIGEMMRPFTRTAPQPGAPILARVGQALTGGAAGPSRTDGAWAFLFGAGSAPGSTQILALTADPVRYNVSF